jgi:hypothetical protein
MQSHFSVRIFEVAVFLEDVIATQTYMDSLFTVHAPNLGRERLEREVGRIS